VAGDAVTALRDLTLVHYSAKRIVFNRHHAYEASGAYKPRGFWVSVLGEQDWPAWCQAEGFNVTALRHAHEVTLRADARVLMLTTLDDLDRFNGQYGRVPKWAKDWAKDLGYKMIEIDWAAVAQQHDGLVIAPYQWERRHEHMWYYGWDCASGCIWNLSAVDRVWTSAKEKKHATR
jgi:hypothetical protein